MNHFASPDFWKLFNQLPVEVQELARALATEVEDGFLRSWIGSHAEDDRIIG